MVEGSETEIKGVPDDLPEHMKLAVQTFGIDDLKPHPRNGEIRNHPDPGTPEWEALEKSLRHDYFDPVVWNEQLGYLVSGHLRVKVMKSKGVKTVDAVVVSYDKKTHLARMIAANKSIGETRWAGFRDILSGFSPFEADLTGFTHAELKPFTTEAPSGNDWEDSAVSSTAADEHAGKVNIKLVVPASKRGEVADLVEAALKEAGYANIVKIIR